MVPSLSPTELVARVQAILCRWTATGSAGPPEPYAIGELTVNCAGRRDSLAGRPVWLTKMEHRVLTYEHLLQQVWGASGGGDARSIRTALSKIRRWLGDDPDNLSMALRNWASAVSKARINVRLIVQHKCHSAMPPLYRMLKQ